MAERLYNFETPDWKKYDTSDMGEVALIYAEAQKELEGYYKKTMGYS